MMTFDPSMVSFQNAGSFFRVGEQISTKLGLKYHWVDVDRMIFFLHKKDQPHPFARKQQNSENTEKSFEGIFILEQLSWYFITFA